MVELAQQRCVRRASTGGPGASTTSLADPFAKLAAQSLDCLEANESSPTLDVITNQRIESFSDARHHDDDT